MLSVQKSNRGVSRFDQSHKLRAVSPEELDSWSDGDSDTTLTEPEFYDLDESSDYMFRVCGVPVLRLTHRSYPDHDLAARRRRLGKDRWRELASWQSLRPNNKKGLNKRRKPHLPHLSCR